MSVHIGWPVAITTPWSQSLSVLTTARGADRWRAQIFEGLRMDLSASHDWYRWPAPVEVPLPVTATAVARLA